MSVFTVKLEEAVKFSQIWTLNGLSLPVSKEMAQYATDFSNVVLTNFITMCQENAKREIEARTPKPLIMEGIR